MRIRPGDEQHGHLLSALGKIDVDVPEIGFGPLARPVAQWDERLAAVVTYASHIAAHLIVAAQVTLFVLQTTKDLHGGVALLGRRLLVIAKNGFDERMKLPQLGRRIRVTPTVRGGLRLAKYFADGATGVMKLLGDFMNAHAILMSSTYLAKLVHLKHPSLHGWNSVSEFQLTEDAGVGPFSAPISPRRGGSLLHADYHSSSGRSVGRTWRSKISPPRRESSSRVRLGSVAGTVDPPKV
jgi:hypothetical protein